MRDPDCPVKWRKQRFRAGQWIWLAGDRGDHWYFIKRGRAAVLIGTGTSDPITLNILGPGDAFGELALLRSDEVRTAHIQALDTVDTVALSREEFTSLRRSEPLLTDVLLAALAERIHELSARLSELATMSKTAVVHRCLIRLGRRFDALHAGGVLPMSQAQLASVAGVGLRTTSSVLSAARAEGLLRTGHRRIEVLDWEGVRRRAELPRGADA